MSKVISPSSSASAQQRRSPSLPILSATDLRAPEVYAVAIDAIVSMAASRASGDIALVWGKGEASFDDLEKAVSRCAGWFSSWFHEVTGRPVHGERVGVFCKKDPGAILVILAALRAGAIVVPLNPALKMGQYEHIAANCAMAAAFLPARLHPQISGRETRWVDNRQPAANEPAFNDIAAWASFDAGTALAHSPAKPSDTALLFYTSGSTGQPKGVMVSHHSNVLGAASVAHYLDLSRQDRVLALLPLSFDYGFNQLVSTWLAGGAVVLHDFFLAGDVVKAAARHGVTGLAAVPPLWHLLMDAVWPDNAASPIRYVTNSGGKLTPDLQLKLGAKLPNADIFAMYGLTEAFRSTYMPPDTLAAKRTAMGRAIPFASVFIVRDDGTPAQAGEAGELVHAGPLVARGYWNDPERTARRFRPLPDAFKGLVDAAYHDRCVFSGDSAFVDDDGDLHFVGRRDEMIKVLGNRLSPQEVEDCVCLHDRVGHAVAFGMDDERLGAKICVVSEVADGVPDNLRESLQALIRTRLPSYAAPHYILARDTFPRSPNGKIDRSAIKEWATSEIQNGKGAL